MKPIIEKRRVAVFVVLGLLAAIGASCSGEKTAGDKAADNKTTRDKMMEDKTAVEMVALNYWQFDQDVNGGWRPYADGGEYARAADLIDHYLAHRTNLIEAQVGYLHLHAGELRAYDGDNKRALEHLAQAYVRPDSMPARFPRSFNALAAGTLAFIAGDMEGVQKAAEAIRALPTLSMRDSMFLWSLEYLTTKEGKTYKEAEEETPDYVR